MVGRWTALMVVVAVMLPLLGCGRKGEPVLPPDSDYPRTYPSR